MKSNNETSTSLCEEYDISISQFSDIRARVNLHPTFAALCLQAARSFYLSEKNRNLNFPSAQEEAVLLAIPTENFGQASIEVSEAENVAGSSFSPSRASPHVELTDILCPACQLCGHFLESDSSFSKPVACSVPGCQHTYHRACIEKSLAPCRSSEPLLETFTCLLCVYENNRRNGFPLDGLWDGEESLSTEVQAAVTQDIATCKEAFERQGDREWRCASCGDDHSPRNLVACPGCKFCYCAGLCSALGAPAPEDKIFQQPIDWLCLYCRGLRGTRRWLKAHVRSLGLKALDHVKQSTKDNASGRHFFTSIHDCQAQCFWEVLEENGQTIKDIIIKELRRAAASSRYLPSLLPSQSLLIPDKFISETQRRAICAEYAEKEWINKKNNQMMETRLNDQGWRSATLSEGTMPTEIRSVALFTSDYGPGNHPTVQLTFRVFINMHEEGVNVILFSFTELDRLSLAVQALVKVIGEKNVVELSNTPPVEAALMILKMKPDIVINTDGHTNKSLEVFQLIKERLKTCTWLSLPLHHGDSITIVDSHVICGQEEELKREGRRIGTLSCYHNSGIHSLFFDIREECARSQISKKSYGLRERPTFACFVRPSRISEKTFKLYMDVLRERTDSQLFLVRTSCPLSAIIFLYDAAIHLGIDSSQVVFGGPLPHLAHLRRMCVVADVGVDTAEGQGANTVASELFWCGKLVVTREGNTFSRQVCSSLAKSLDIPELCTRSDAQFVKTISSLLADKTYRDSFEPRLSKGVLLTKPVFDNKKCAQELLSLFRQIITAEPSVMHISATESPILLPQAAVGPTGGRPDDPGSRAGPAGPTAVNKPSPSHRATAAPPADHIGLVSRGDGGGLE